MNNAVQYLTKNVDNSKIAYEASLVAYALVLANHTMKTRAFDILKAYAVEERDEGNYYQGNPVSSY